MALVDAQAVLDDCQYHTLQGEDAKEEDITIRDVFSTGSRGINSILHVVQMSRIFSDSKTFVDMKLKHSPGHIVRQFDALVAEGNAACKDHLAQFVNDNFTLEEQMEEHTPDDWTESPRLLSRVADARLKAFVSELNARWKMLCRRIAADVQRSPELYSLIYLPHPVVIPGGRFREVYYWDSYWIIRGLILSEMFSTVKGMLLNFVHLIKEFGFVPNGGRTYYLCRSQPPLFILMVDEYVSETGDTEFIKENIQFMVTEFEYWVEHHFVTVVKGDQEFKLARYNCEENGPRPESYFEK